MEYRKLTLDDISVLSPYFAYGTGRLCDNTIGGTFMWRDYFDIEYRLAEDNVIFKAKISENKVAYSMPLGKNAESALDEIYEECSACGEDPLFIFASEEDKKILGEHFEINAFAEEDWFDYLYNINDLATLVGRRYSGQRNHKNAFARLYPDGKYRRLAEGDAEQAEIFYKNAPIFTEKSTPLFREEREKTLEVLHNLEKYGMTGGAVYAEGKMCAFALGEIKGDTLYVHIEKADSGVRGAYQMITSCFAEDMLKTHPELKYVNREDDAGDEGLRRSKLSYHPCELIKKYTVFVSEKKLERV